MGLFKPTSGEKKDADSGMSLLKGLLVLAIIGIIAYLVVNHYAG
ncbi:hypothetical protein [Pusillimonas noertemannii]|uniref:Uncharacterized protein n=1 Tax=Pusillimonas noertemannii TaxID=305977 RepID=A0A2U1CK82_9BURK|nr:hypothetical protein [Pusillimonas noertemannii]PVY61403.1 hypothetical protein C7440_2954 [Pusillimonas noertemannii]